MGKGWGNKGKGKGKGKFRKMDPQNTVWVGGLAEETTYKELFEHAKQAGTAKWAEVFKGGTGAIESDSAVTASTAIMTLNGTTLGSATITCDVWEKKQKES